MSGLRRLTLTRCSGEASTALRVTSEPVPAVVGIAMKRSRSFGERLAAANDLQVIEQLAVVGEHGGDGFACVQRAAAARS